MMNITLMSRLAEIRKDKGIFLKDIAKNTGVKVQTLGRYERGLKEIPLVVFEKYADCLGYELKLMIK